MSYDFEQGVIDESGYLSIFRAGRLKKQYCPYQSEERCGDWCPNFSEPYFNYEINLIEHSSCLCTWGYKQFVDRRKEDNV